MTYEQALDYIHSFRRFGKKAGLTKITRLLSLLGEPHKRLSFVHVAGTNGKGSIVAMTASILQAAGYRTGMYISPYVVDFTERMQVNGEYIPPEELARCTALVKPMVDIVTRELEAPSEFEVVTAIGLVWFSERRCDIVCLEVGLGGRLDPTNVIDTPLAAVIANLGLDHTEILGGTLEQIAAEKAGIIKKNATVVCYPSLAAEALAVILEKAAQQGARVVMGNENAAHILRSEVFFTQLEYGGLSITLPLAGAHQVKNLICVLEVIEVLRQKGYAITDAAIQAGIASVRFPARMEMWQGPPRVVIDGAHNPQSVRAFAETAARVTGRRILLYSSLADKDYHAALRVLAPLFDHIYTAAMSCPRAERVEPLYEAARAVNPSCTLCTSLPEALEHAISDAGARGCGEAQGTVFICGSLFLASEVRPLVISRFRT